MQVSAAAAAQVNSSTPGPAAPPLPRGTTETANALEAMTPQTRRLIPEPLLDARIGRGTLAGSLNDQIRFRVVGDGPMAERDIVPDSPLAHAVLESRAGEKLLRQLRTGVASTGDLHEVSNLQGFILPRDTDAVLAGTVLATIDSTRPLGREIRRLALEGRKDEVSALFREAREAKAKSLARAGAWNADGWITFVPDTARAMLVAAGAYDPHGSHERDLRRATGWSKYIVGNVSHEVQHSVSRPSPTAYQGAARWIEEGTANVFSRTPVLHARARRDSGVNRHSYAAHLAHEPAIDLGWKPWKRPQLPPAEQERAKKEQARNYGDSHAVLLDLARLAGADFRSNAGIDRARDLLQRKSMRYTPGVLAKAIIERHDLDPSVYERLRTRIAGAVDVPGGVSTIAREFGIGQ